MRTVQIIDRDLLKQASSRAKESPRRRMNYNFHASEGDACHRLLNAIEPDSYIPPHCHHDARKDETLIVVRGRIGVVFFDERGSVTSKALLAPGGDASGVNIPHGVYHTLVALEPDSVFFEVKAGPYAPLKPEERAPWAPTEGEPQASSYLVRMKQLFA